MTDPMSFGEVEAILATVHNIDNKKRTAFQARVKNFQRLGYPPNLKSRKGRPTQFRPGDLCMIAIAIELTQLGLSPERTKNLIFSNALATTQVVRLAAEALMAHNKGFSVLGSQPKSFFLCFDPLALEQLIEDRDPTLTDLVFYADESTIADWIVKFTTGTSSRVGVVNITSMLDLIIHIDPKARVDFLFELSRWTTEAINKFDWVVAADGG